ncbi:MAG: hypothetical protein KJ023_00100 [Burkholderiaceae bacterium]|nr:hypothetical protein [Burkholderiaceae bacterium]
MGLALGGALSVTGLAAFLRTTVEGIDKLNDLSDATGASVEKLSALEDAAVRTGTSVDVVGDALIKLNKTIADAKPGSDAAQALKAIGLSAKELRELDPADALLRVAQGMAGLADDGKKARLANELFGKSLREVAPLLKDLVERGQLNATVTKEQAEQAEKFAKQSAELNKNLTDLARDITSVVVPALNKLFERSKKEGFFSALFGEDEEALAIRKAKAIGQRLQRVTRELDDAIASGDKDRIERIRGQLFLLSAAATQATDKLKGVGADAPSARDLLRGIEAGSAEKPSAPDIGGKVEVTEFDKFIKRLQEAQLATVELTEVERTRIAINKGELGAITKDQEAYALSLAATADLLRRLADTSKLALQSQAGQLEELDKQSAAVRRQFADGVISATAYARALEVLAQKFKGLQDNTNVGGDKFRVDVAKLAAQTRDAQVDNLAAQIANVREQMAGASGDTSAFRRALAVLGEQMRAVEDNGQALTEKLGQMDEATREFALEIESALGASIVATMEGSSSKIDRIWGDLLKRLVVQAANAKLMSVLFGDSFTSRGELGGWLGRLFGAGAAGGTGAAGSGAGVKVGGEFLNTQAGKPLSAGMAGKSQASAPAGVTQHIYVQGDVGTRARRAMLAVAAQIQSRQQRAAAI